MIFDNVPAMVECSKCGCLLNKDTAIKGKKKIVGEIVCDYYDGEMIEDKIVQEYFCKKCGRK